MNRKKLFFYFLNSFLGLILVGSFRAGLFSGIEQFFEDILFSKKEINKDIVIIGIDNESIQKIGQWPWPRAVFAKALSNLEQYKPKSVGLDVIFPEASRIGEADDWALVRAMEGLKYPLVMPVEFTSVNIDGLHAFVERGAPLVKNLKIITDVSLTAPAHVNLILDRDGVVRRVPLWIEIADSSVINKALGLKTVESAGLRHRNSYPKESIERIVFAGPPGSFPMVPFWKVYEGNIDLPLLNKIIFIGSTAADLHDEKPTPFSRGTAMSGVEIQAEIANMILQDYKLAPISEGWLEFWIFFATLLPALLFSFSERPWKALGVNVVLGIFYNVAIIYLFGEGQVANIVHINLAWISGSLVSFAYHYFTVEKEKNHLRNLFSKYVSRDILEEMLRDPSKIKLGGDEKETTVFFSDVRGFTNLSEGLTPGQLVHFLNKYLTVMTDIALKKRGVVDKYIGDAIMAFWGAPLTNKMHAVDAVLTSLEMVTALKKFNEKSVSEGDPAIDIGIGLNSGKVIAGNMGSEQQFDYTVMGDTVNLASRLEGQTKTYGVHIIISQHTFDHLPAELIEKEKILIRELDRVKVKGKKLPVTIFEVVEREKEEAVKGILSDFEKARRFYYNGDWQEVKKITEDILKKLNDGPTRLLNERALYFIEHPPATWEGVYEFKTK
ncbi:MAG: adenylate/guanylate cyclase domain-containing protein [bacterium]|nr:adenylate/guanylate cyclase domain-containing protein [bacterium]